MINNQNSENKEVIFVDEKNNDHVKKMIKGKIIAATRIFLARPFFDLFFKNKLMIKPATNRARLIINTWCPVMLLSVKKCMDEKQRKDAMKTNLSESCLCRSLQIKANKNTNVLAKNKFATSILSR